MSWDWEDQFPPEAPEDFWCQTCGGEGCDVCGDGLDHAKVQLQLAVQFKADCEMAEAYLADRDLANDDCPF